jgi:hypothetical protein
MSTDDVARLNSLLGAGIEVVPVPPREYPANAQRRRSSTAPQN